MASAAPARLSRGRLRGQPLLFLVTVLSCWTAARVIHHLPASETPARSVPALSIPAGLLAVAAADRGARIAMASATRPGLPENANTGIRRTRSALALASDAADFDTAMAHHRLWVESLMSPSVSGGGSALFDGPLLTEAIPDGPERDGATAPGAAVQHRQTGWSIYAWSLARSGGGNAALAPGAQYGGSQAGVIVRYALADTGSLAALYARATTALATGDDRTLAMGISARPWGPVPIDLAVERRFALADGQKDRFAAMLVAGGGARLARSQVRVEAFAQAGLVGLRDRQGFFDLQMLATREVVAQDRHTVAIGAGLWAGGQQEADGSGAQRWVHRVDMGPRAALALPLGDASMTVALDWRQRIDGDARPASGAALTLSTGF